jgi:hypothetical protein
VDETRFAPTAPERIARNQAIFREANETLRQRVEALEAVAGPSSQVIAATDRSVIAKRVGEAGEHAERFADEGTAA